MSDRPRVAAVVLAAGEGRRLRPLTEAVPKALCPVGNVPLLDLALRRLAELGFEGTDRVAVNAWYLAPQIVAAVHERAYVSVEGGTHPLGTAGGLARLRDWLDGRGVLAVNADAYLAACIAGLGIVQVPRARRDPAVESLVEILPEHTARPLPISLLHAHGRSVPRRVRAVMSWIADLLTPMATELAATPRRAR